MVCLAAQKVLWIIFLPMSYHISTYIIAFLLSALYKQILMQHNKPFVVCIIGLRYKKWTLSFRQPIIELWAGIMCIEGTCCYVAHSLLGKYTSMSVNDDIAVLERTQHRSKITHVH